MNKRIVTYLLFLYLSLPVFIFFFGWLHSAYALILSGLVLVGVWKYLERTVDTFAETTTPVGTVNPWQWVLIAGLAFGWVFFSGIGGFANQDWDHHFRNALFRDLIVEDWPVYYKFPASYPDAELANHHSALNYYLTFWLPAALAGKVWGADVAPIFLLLWSYAGVLLVLYYLNRLFRFRYTLLVSLLFMGWSGLDVLSRLLTQPLANFTTFQLEANELYSYTAFTSTLYNVFNQAIPTWLITLWVFNHPNRLNLLPIAFLLAYAPFPFVGLILLYYTYYVLNRLTRERTTEVLSGVLTELFRLENVVAVVGLVLPYILFYSAHSDSVPSDLFWSRHLVGTRREKLLVVVGYFITFFLEAGVYLLSIILLSKRVYQTYKRLFWLCFVTLLFLPVWIVGTGNDFASRSSMPFLVMLCVMTTKALIDGIENQASISRLTMPSLALLMAWVTPAVAVIDGIAFQNPPNLRDSIGTFASPNVSRATNVDGIYPSLVNYYAHDPKQHFFYKYLTKK